MTSSCTLGRHDASLHVHKYLCVLLGLGWEGGWVVGKAGGSFGPQLTASRQAASNSR